MGMPIAQDQIQENLCLCMTLSVVITHGIYTLKTVLGDKGEDMAFDALFQLLPGGWEINEGSQGHLIWDIANDKVEVNHEWNVRTTEHEDSVAELSFEGV